MPTVPQLSDSSDSTVSTELTNTASPKAPSLRSLGLRGLLATIATAILALCILWGALQGIFLALQVQTIDPKGAAQSLAVVVGVGAMGSMIASPIAGMLTDRTRTRFGGRIPWMVVGAAATLVVALFLATAHTVLELTIYWFLVQLATNFVLTPVLVHIPERVPLSRRGLFSSVMGVSQMAGFVLGQSIGAAFSTMIPIGYAVTGSILLVVVIAFALTNARSNLDIPRPRLSLLKVLKTFWVNPRKHPNFAWVFTGRFLLMVGYFPLQAYLLYILQDFIHLGQDAVAVVPILGTANLVGSIVGTGISGWLVDKIRATKPIIYGASAIMILAFAFPLLWQSVPSMLIYSFVGAFGLGAFMAVDYVLITEVLPSADDAGKDLGIINISTTLPQTIGAAVAGPVIAVFSGYSALFPAAIVFVIIGAACLFLVRNVR